MSEKKSKCEIQERGEALNHILHRVDLRPNRGLSSSANIATITCPDNIVTVASYNNNNTIHNLKKQKCVHKSFSNLSCHNTLIKVSAWTPMKTSSGIISHLNS